MEEKFSFAKYDNVIYTNYVVSSEGYVLSYKYGKSRKLKPKLNKKDEYERVSLCQDGIIKTCLVHRVIYESFNLFENLKGKDIDHIDCSKSNNRLCNLRSCSRFENSCNRGSNRNNKIGIKGIRITQNNTYNCRIIKDRIEYTKNFQTIEEGQQWLSEMRQKLHGEYARDS